MKWTSSSGLFLRRKKAQQQRLIKQIAKQPVYKLTRQSCSIFSEFYFNSLSTPLNATKPRYTSRHVKRTNTSNGHKSTVVVIFCYQLVPTHSLIKQRQQSRVRAPPPQQSDAPCARFLAVCDKSYLETSEILLTLWNQHRKHKQPETKQQNSKAQRQIPCDAACGLEPRCLNEARWGAGKETREERFYFSAWRAEIRHPPRTTFSNHSTPCFFSFLCASERE